MEQSGERVITLSGLIRVFRRSVIFMIIAAILVSGALIVYNRMSYREEFTSRASLFILRTNDSLYEDKDMTAGQEATYAILIMNNCEALMRLDIVYQDVISTIKETEGEDYGLTIGKLHNSISISIYPDTSVMSVSATAESPELAQKILNYYTAEVKERLEGKEGFNHPNMVKIQGKGASLPTAPSNSSFSLTSLLLGVFAAVLVYAIFFCIDFFNDTISKPEDLEQISDLAILGMIPNSECSTKYAYRGYRAYAAYRNEPAAESQD